MRGKIAGRRRAQVKSSRSSISKVTTNIQNRKMGQSFTKLFCLLFGKMEVGLDAAGKTTIINKLKFGEIVTTIPGFGINVETIEYKNISFSMVDIGVNMCRWRPILSRYFEKAQGIIFVVDSSDRDRVVDARDQLHTMLKEHGLKDTVLLVCANKQDLPGAMNVAEITEQLGLDSLGLQHWYIKSTSAISGEGLYEGLDWLSNNIVNKA